MFLPVRRLPCCRCWGSERWAEGGEGLPICLPIPTTNSSTTAWKGHSVSLALMETHKHYCRHLASPPSLLLLHTHTHSLKRQANYTQKLLRPFPRGYLHVYLFVFFQIFDLCLRLTGNACWQVPGEAFGSTLKMIWGQTDWEMKGVTGKQTKHNRMPQYRSEWKGEYEGGWGDEEKRRGKNNFL